MAQEAAVMTAVAAGLVDRVARKAPREMDTTGDQGKRRKGKYPVPYMCCSATVPGLLFIHPQSSVFDHDPAKVGGLHLVMWALLCPPSSSPSSALPLGARLRQART
jgi:hypothetical protein